MEIATGGLAGWGADVTALERSGEVLGADGRGGQASQSRPRSGWLLVVFRVGVHERGKDGSGCRWVAVSRSWQSRARRCFLGVGGARGEQQRQRVHGLAGGLG